MFQTPGLVHNDSGAQMFDMENVLPRTLVYKGELWGSTPPTKMFKLKHQNI